MCKGILIIWLLILLFVRFHCKNTVKQISNKITFIIIVFQKRLFSSVSEQNLNEIKGRVKPDMFK
jgi:hypothetical protein